MQSKMPRVIDHCSISDMLQSVSPTFVPTNGCLSDKKDRALSLCLLAAVRAIDSMPGTVCSAAAVSQDELEAFESALISELRAMGVADPTASVKAGGVGEDTVEYVAERFLFSARGNGQCPATVSVIGALAAQEVIKAITKVHVPITQFLMFESLDSVLLPLTAPTYDVTASAPENLSASMTARVYGEEVAAELARLRVFIVGSGAIGCELLKTFALLGVGTGPSPTGIDIDTDTTSTIDGRSVRQGKVSVTDGPWSGLSQGGVVLADMDLIERSNLNRQLLFREKHVGLAKCVVAADSIKQVGDTVTGERQRNDEFYTVSLQIRET
jgi:ThiF family